MTYWGWFFVVLSALLLVVNAVFFAMNPNLTSAVGSVFGVGGVLSGLSIVEIGR